MNGSLIYVILAIKLFIILPFEITGCYKTAIDNQWELQEQVTVLTLEINQSPIDF